MANEVDGYAAPGLEPVVAKFERNFTQRGEVGAAFAVARGDELLVDLRAASVIAEPTDGGSKTRFN